MAPSLPELAGLVRDALGTADLEALGRLLAPDACWGPADEPGWGCTSRAEVLAYYRAAREQGMRAAVDEVVVVEPDQLLVGLTVSGTPAAAAQGGTAARWQVLTVRDGLVADIRGFDDRDRAVARASA